MTDSDRLEIEAWVDGVDDSAGGITAQAVDGGAISGQPSLRTFSVDLEWSPVHFGLICGKWNGTVRRFLGRLVDRERRALERLEGQQAMYLLRGTIMPSKPSNYPCFGVSCDMDLPRSRYTQIEFGLNTLDLGLLMGLVRHAESSGQLTRNVDHT